MIKVFFSGQKEISADYREFMTVFSPLYGHQNMTFLYTKVQKLARGDTMIYNLNLMFCSGELLDFLLYKKVF